MILNKRLSQLVEPRSFMTHVASIASKGALPGGCFRFHCWSNQLNQ